MIDPQRVGRIICIRTKVAIGKFKSNREQFRQTMCEGSYVCKVIVDGGSKLWLIDGPNVLGEEQRLS